MSTSGKAKWEKYFKGRNIDTVLKQDCLVWAPFEDKVIGKLIAGHPVYVPAMDTYQSKYLVKIDDAYPARVTGNALAKPKAKSLDIHTLHFMGSAYQTTIKFQGIDIPVHEFICEEQIGLSILRGLHEYSFTQKASQTVRDYMFKDEFRWDDETLDEEKDKIGAYLGELLFGYSAFKYDVTKFSVNFEPIIKVYMPSNSNFAGVDSIMETKSGNRIAVSSKYGIGARASIFSNLIPRGLEIYDQLEPSVFKRILTDIKDHNITPERNGRQIVYLYGLLSLGMEALVDPMTLYTQIKGGNIDAKTQEVIDYIHAYVDLNPKIKEALPNSITAFLCRMMAKDLNKDPKSIEQCKAILTQKDFWQANLNMKKWRTGEAFWNMKHSSEVDIRFIGYKSPMTDISAQQGLVNYELSQHK